VPRDSYYEIWQSAKGCLSGGSGDAAHRVSPGSASGLAPHVENYFEQVFSVERPSPYDVEALRDACDGAPWPVDEAEAVYLKCGGMSAGMTSIMSQVKVCLKMAVETGSHLVLPAMPLRDSHDLLDFNFLTEAACLNYDEWFDADHLRENMARACPRMKIVHPAELHASIAVRHTWNVACANAWGYRPIYPYFWVEQPFRNFFAEQLRLLREKAADTAGITVVEIDSEFLLFRIADDPTRRDLRFWTDLSHLIRFRPEPRILVRRLLDHLGPRPYLGVHFRVENDRAPSTTSSRGTSMP